MSKIEITVDGRPLEEHLQKKKAIDLMEEVFDEANGKQPYCKPCGAPQNSRGRSGKVWKFKGDEAQFILVFNEMPTVTQAKMAELPPMAQNYIWEKWQRANKRWSWSVLYNLINKTWKEFEE